MRDSRKTSLFPFQNPVSIYEKYYYYKNNYQFFLYKIINYYFCAIVRGRLRSMSYAAMQIFFIDAACCTYKAIFLFTALFRSMTYFRKSIKSRLVLSRTWSTNIPLWETGLNDSHVGSTTAHREVVSRYHCLTSSYVEQRIRKAFAQSIPSCS